MGRAVITCHHTVWAATFSVSDTVVIFALTLDLRSCDRWAQIGSLLTIESLVVGIVMLRLQQLDNYLRLGQLVGHKAIYILRRFTLR